MKRREFLKAAALAAGGLSLPVLAQGGGASAKACLHTFSKPLQWLGYDALAETLAQAGFGGIDLSVRPKGHVEPAKVEQDLPRAVEAARKQGLKVEMMVTAITAADEPLVERVLKTAAQCGVKVYRMGYVRYDAALGVEGSIEKNHKQMAALEALNRSCGITGCYQNHYAWNGDGLFGGPVWDIYYMLKGLDPQWIGCQYDVRHAVAEAGGSWSVALKLIAPYIRSTCLKDFFWAKLKGKWQPEDVFAGEGMVPWDRYFTLLKELKITGPASVHCEWDLFSKEEQALPEGDKRGLAVSRMKRDRDFFAAQYEKHGISTESKDSK
jgi:sugar phosphate isomerase/epimerase